MPTEKELPPAPLLLSVPSTQGLSLRTLLPVKTQPHHKDTIRWTMLKIQRQLLKSCNTGENWRN
jgi:hypothetical protein